MVASKYKKPVVIVKLCYSYVTINKDFIFTSNCRLIVFYSLKADFKSN